MATKKTSASGKAAPLDPKVAGKLLDKLSTDNDFRRLFKKDPKAALLSVGHKEAGAGDGGGIYDCCQVDRIAPKAEIVKARDELLKQFTAGMSQSPIQLNVADSASRRTLK